MQPQAGAFADYLGGEKRAENVFQIFRINAVTSVTDRHLGPPVRTPGSDFNCSWVRRQKPVQKEL